MVTSRPSRAATARRSAFDELHARLETQSRELSARLEEDQRLRDLSDCAEALFKAGDLDELAKLPWEAPTADHSRLIDEVWRNCVGFRSMQAKTLTPELLTFLAERRPTEPDFDGLLHEALLMNDVALQTVLREKFGARASLLVVLHGLGPDGFGLKGYHTRVVKYLKTYQPETDFAEVRVAVAALREKINAFAALVDA